MKYYSIYYIFKCILYIIPEHPHKGLLVWLLVLIPHSWFFSLLSVIQFLWCYIWEFGIGSTNNLQIDIFLYSHYLSSKHCIDIVRRNSVLATHRSKMIKHLLLNTPFFPFKDSTWWPFLCSVPWTLGYEVWVQDLDGSLCCVLRQNILLPQSLSKPRSINEH